MINSVNFNTIFNIEYVKVNFLFFIIKFNV